MFSFKSLSSLLLVTCSLVSPSYAGRPGTPATPIIHNAAIDMKNLSVTMMGANFGSAAPRVMFGNQSLTIQDHSATKITAKLLNKPLAATYRLTVTNSAGKGDTAESYIAVIE